MIRRDHKRIFTLESDGKSLETPFFFPAISSIRTNFPPVEYLRLLITAGYPGFLISAYDIHHAQDHDKKQIFDLLVQCNQRETMLLLDSGNYEASWKCDGNWSMNQLESVLAKVSIEFCLSFDVFRDESQDVNEHLGETMKMVYLTAGMQKTGMTIPIIHSSPKDFPTVVKKLVDTLNPEVVAIAERELGLSIFERARTIRKIRSALDRAKKDVALHLLGTGNPISILVYTLCGADMFDGLEWCKTVANPQTGQLLHFVQKDLFECKCQACKAGKTPYHAKVMGHNLIFLADFIGELRDALKNDATDALLRKYLSENAAVQVEKIAGVK